MQTLCRICTRRLGRVSYDFDTAKIITEFFGCDHTSNNPAVHPPRFCNSCYLSMRQTLKARQNGTVHRTSLSLHPWEEHHDGTCSTCDMVVGRSGGGRPKKRRNIPSCPSSLSLHIQKVAGPQYRCSVPLTPTRFLSCPEAGSGLCTDDVMCKCCNEIVDQAVEVPCKHLMCYGCCLKLLTTHLNFFPCPHCKKNHDQAVSTFQAPSPLAVKFLQQLVIRCDREDCTEAVHLKDLKTHLDCKFRKDSTTSILQSITLDQIMDQPPNAPPTRVEIEAAGLVVRKILSQSESQGLISLPTGGCVSGWLWLPLHCLHIYPHAHTASHTHQNNKAQHQF